MKITKVDRQAAAAPRVSREERTQLSEQSPPPQREDARPAPPPPPEPHPAAWGLLPTLRQPGIRNLHFFCLALRSNIEAGVPIVRAFHLIAESQHCRTLRNACEAVSHDLELGVPFRQALESRGGVFSPFFIQVVMAGHRSGSIVRSLDLLIEHYLWIWEVRTALIKTFVYPLFCLFAGAGIMAARDCIAAGIQGENSSREMLRIVWSYFQPLFLGGACAFLVSRILKSQPIRPLTDEVAMRLPIIRKHHRQKSLAVFFRTLALSLEAGCEVGTGLRNAVEAMDNHFLARRLRGADKYLRDGHSFYEALALSRAADDEALGMVRAGEAGGSLPELAQTLAEYYMTDTRAMSVGWAKALYPLMMVSVAGAFFVSTSYFFAGAFIMFFFIFMTA